MTTPTHLYFGGRTHAPRLESPGRSWPLCRIRTKARPQKTTGPVTCIRCLTLLGQPVPDELRGQAVVRAPGGGWIGWTRERPGTYTAQIPGRDGVTTFRWSLEHNYLDPDAGWNHTGWYLFGPDGEPFGELMFTGDGDGRLPAAMTAADAYISGRPRPDKAGG